MRSWENAHNASSVVGSHDCVGCGTAVGAVFWRAASRGLPSCHLLVCVWGCLVCFPSLLIQNLHYYWAAFSVLNPFVLLLAILVGCPGPWLKLSAIIINPLLRHLNRDLLFSELTLVPSHLNPFRNEFECYSWMRHVYGAFYKVQLVDKQGTSRWHARIYSVVPVVLRVDYK